MEITKENSVSFPGLFPGIAELFAQQDLRADDFDGEVSYVFHGEPDSSPYPVNEATEIEQMRESPSRQSMFLEPLLTKLEIISPAPAIDKFSPRTENDLPLVPDFKPLSPKQELMLSKSPTKEPVVEKTPKPKEEPDVPPIPTPHELDPKNEIDFNPVEPAKTEEYQATSEVVPFDDHLEKEKSVDEDDKSAVSQSTLLVVEDVVEENKSNKLDDSDNFSDDEMFAEPPPMLTKKKTNEKETFNNLEETKDQFMSTENVSGSSKKFRNSVSGQSRSISLGETATEQNVHAPSLTKKRTNRFKSLLSGMSPGGSVDEEESLVDENGIPLEPMEIAKKRAQQVARRLEKMQEDQRLYKEETAMLREKQLKNILVQKRTEEEKKAMQGKSKGFGFSSIKAGLSHTDFLKTLKLNPVRPELRQQEEIRLKQHVAQQEQKSKINLQKTESIDETPISSPGKRYGGQRFEDSEEFSLNDNNTTQDLPSPSIKQTRRKLRSSHGFKESDISSSQMNLNAFIQSALQSMNHLDIEYETPQIFTLEDLTSDSLIDQRFSWARRKTRDEDNDSGPSPSGKHGQTPSINGSAKVRRRSMSPKSVRTTFPPLISRLEEADDFVFQQQQKSGNVAPKPFQITSDTTIFPPILSAQPRSKTVKSNLVVTQEDNPLEISGDLENFLDSEDTIHENYSGLLYRDPSYQRAWKDHNMPPHTPSGSFIGSSNNLLADGWVLSEQKELQAGKMLNEYRPWSSRQSRSPVGRGKRVDEFSVNSMSVDLDGNSLSLESPSPRSKTVQSEHSSMSKMSKSRMPLILNIMSVK